MSGGWKGTTHAT